MSTSERKTYSVSVGNIKTFIQSDGRVALKDELNLDFANVGIIQKILLKEGDPVEK